MRIHRFYTGTEVELGQDFWLHDERLINQWRRVLRYQPGQELVLFDGVTHDRLYKLVEINEREAHLQHITDFKRKVPTREIYLLWALLKKDKNDWVMQKCTELGVSHFIPLLADRSEKTGFNVERAEKIVIEAAEQCGRSDIPLVREPMHIATALKELSGKAEIYACEQSDEKNKESGIKNQAEYNSLFLIHNSENAIGILIGPEGGWSDSEKDLFKEQNLKHLSLHDFTLRAETACISALSKLV